jgi:transcriptional regulator with XRE-family HTH domain
MPLEELDERIIAIGPKVRELRRQKNFSLQQLSERSGVSVAAIHKIERNGMVPTVATLMKLAIALNRPMSYFVEEDAADLRPAVVIRAHEGKPVFTSKTGIDLRNISGPYGRFFMHGAKAVIEPGGESGLEPMVHPGEEFVYLLSGTLSFNVDGEVFVLSPGDALHFRTDRPHLWRNPGEEPAEAIWMTLRST